MQTKTIIINSIPTEYIVSDSFDGSTDSYVFLHGWMQDCRSFSSIMEKFEQKNISFVSLSFPGFGKTGYLHENATIFDYSNFTKEFIKKLNIQNPSLIGHSFGGRVSIILGSENIKISKIVLIGAAGIKVKQSIIKKSIIGIGKTIFSLPGLSGIGDKIKNEIGSRDYNSSGKLKQTFINVLNQDLTDLLSKIRLPVLLIWGKDDTETPISDAYVMHNNIIGSRLEIFDDADHFVFQQKSKEVIQLILKF